MQYYICTYKLNVAYFIIPKMHHIHNLSSRKVVRDAVFQRCLSPISGSLFVPIIESRARKCCQWSRFYAVRLSESSKDM